VEFRTIVGDGGYQRNPSDGETEVDPAPARYLLSVKLHDMHDPKR